MSPKGDSTLRPFFVAKALSGWKARRYAIALLQAAVKADELDQVEAEVQALSEMLNRSPQLMKFLAQPLVPFEEKAKRLRRAVGRACLTCNAQLLARRRQTQTH
jgi:F0F1-type ATP synthase delta subunit